MAESETPKPAPNTPQEARRARLAQALRANLKRRKAPRPEPEGR